MADLSHELGALRFVVDSPLSSKVAMFNNQVAQHKTAQLLNPFSQTDGRSSPKPDITKDDYGKPLAGSLTEMRGQKANMHVMREMLELCQIIDSEGYDVKDEQNMRVITFGELFNIYNYISDKCVGLLLRARKHKLVDFEGEMLFQRRDDDVPIFLLRPIVEIRHELNDKIECIKRAGSPAPQATSVILDKKANGLGVPASRKSASRTPSPHSSKSSSPVKETKPTEKPVAAPSTPAAPTPVNSPLPAPVATHKEAPKIHIIGEAAVESKVETTATIQEQTEQVPETKIETSTTIEAQKEQAPQDIKEAGVTADKEDPKVETTGEALPETKSETSTAKQSQNEQAVEDIKEASAPMEVKTEAAPQLTNAVTEVPTNAVKETQSETIEQPTPTAEISDDANKNGDDLPTVVIEATAVYRRPSAPTAEVNAILTPEPAVV